MLLICRVGFRRDALRFEPRCVTMNILRCTEIRVSVWYNALPEGGNKHNRWAAAAVACLLLLLAACCLRDNNNKQQPNSQYKKIKPKSKRSTRNTTFKFQKNLKKVVQIIGMVVPVVCNKMSTLK